MKKTLLINTDNRQHHLAKLLDAKEITLQTPEEEITLDGIEEVILPTPVRKLPWQGEVCKKLRKELINKTETVRIYGGAFDAEWSHFLEEQIHSSVDLMRDRTVKTENAVITAEAVVAEYMRHSDVSIQGSRIWVTGFGDCGREIAIRFQAMGAYVTVFARSSEARLAARERGMSAYAFSDENAYEKPCDSVINTVPGLVIGERMIKALKKGTLLLEVASAPGGIDLELAQKQGMRVENLMGLPGVYTTKSSAMVLFRAICRDRKIREEL